MTDTQLSVLLYQYSSRLTALLDDAEDALPDEAKPEITHIPTGLEKGVRQALGQSIEPQTYRTCPALAELREFAQELRQDSELLELTARNEKPQPR